MTNEKEEYDFEWEGDYTRTWMDKMLFEWIPMGLIMLVAGGALILLAKHTGIDLSTFPFAL